MLTRQLGRTALQVRALCLGGNVFGWTCDEPTSLEVLNTYVVGGGNFIDTADSYSAWLPGHTGGESETIIGRWMKSRGNREGVIIATKVGSRMSTGPNMQGLLDETKHLGLLTPRFRETEEFIVTFHKAPALLPPPVHPQD